jgi:hypothetical protein
MFVWKAIIIIGITLNFIAYLFGGNKNWGE